MFQNNTFLNSYGGCHCRSTESEYTFLGTIMCNSLHDFRLISRSLQLVELVTIPAFPAPPDSQKQGENVLSIPKLYYYSKHAT